MKINQKDFEEEIEIDLSPMIDMVFLLLIFFIVASQIIDEKPKLEALPEAIHAKVPDDTTGRLMISVKKDGTYFLGTSQVAVKIEDLKEQLVLEAEADPERDLKILIRAEGDTPYKYNEKITMACAEVGFQDMIYSVFEE